MRFQFLYADKYVFKTGWIYPESFVPYNMIRYIVKGNAIFVIDGKETPIHEKQIVYIPQGCNLACSTLDNYFEFYSIRFRLSSQKDAGDFLSDYYNIQPVTDVPDANGILPYFEELYKNAAIPDSKNAGKMFRIKGNLELIIAWLVEHHAETASDISVQDEADFTLAAIQRREMKSVSYNQDPRIQIVIDYLNHHIDEQLSLESLSNMAGICQSSLRRLFKEQCGKTVGEYIIELRMTTAARQLLVSDKTISEISYAVGYEDSGYFTRKFRHYFGVSPNEYRKNARI